MKRSRGARSFRLLAAVGAAADEAKLWKDGLGDAVRTDRGIAEHNLVASVLNEGCKASRHSGQRKLTMLLLSVCCGSTAGMKQAQTVLVLSCVSNYWRPKNYHPEDFRRYPVFWTRGEAAA